MELATTELRLRRPFGGRRFGSGERRGWLVGLRGWRWRFGFWRRPECRCRGNESGCGVWPSRVRRRCGVVNEHRYVEVACRETLGDVRKVHANLVAGGGIFGIVSGNGDAAAGFVW